MDDDVVHRVLQEGGRDYYQQAPSTSSSSPSILQSLPLHASFDRGYYLLVKSIQELRSKKEGIVAVGIGGPSGSGKSSLAEKVASVIGCSVISMENYRIGADEGNDLNSLDFDLLVQNLQDLLKGKDISTPVFDFQQKKRIGTKEIKSIFGVVIVDGTYALHARLRSLLDIRVAVVGGVHFSLLSKVQYDIGDPCSLDNLIDSIFPLFRKHIEPDLHHAQIRINNSFGASFRDSIYKLKCKTEVCLLNLPGLNLTSNFLGSLGPFLLQHQLTQSSSPNSFLIMPCHHQIFIEMYLRPPSASEVAGVNDWIKVRQSGIRYYLSLGDQRIVDKNFIIRPKAEFEVGRMTLGGLLALGYNVVVSYKRASKSIIYGNLSISLETIDTLDETYLVLRGRDRKPLRIRPELVNRDDDISQPWTRSPTKSKVEPVLAPWRFISDGSVVDGSSIGMYLLPKNPSSFRDTLQLAPMPDSFDLDRGLLLAVQAIQSEQVKDFKYDDFRSLDLALLTKNISDIRRGRKAKVPVFDLESGARSGYKELEVSEDCGVVIIEGVYALHPDIRKSLDLWVAVVGGVHSHLISRVHRDKSRAGCFMSQNEIMTTVFPMFQLHIEPHLVHAHLKIRNDFDPVLSPESSLFVLKSNKQVAYQDILKLLDPAKICSSAQNFIDIYLRLSGIPSSGQLTESDCMRVRICEGRFALLIREPIREGDFVIQPKVDFDISISTVSGLLNLGYQAVAYIEASAYIYQDGKLLIEVDHLQDVPGPYIQIKGASKEVVVAAGSTLELDGSYTTKSYLEIVLEKLPASDRSSSGINGAMDVPDVRVCWIFALSEEAPIIASFLAALESDTDSS
ncbi:CYTH-like domain-containing protein [Cynara cardunculus var. scolymus]|uniref:CYTH-like domain-containing protein n=1 Tax=Cynara cardunculus var. scolymus TaxID=59895 RepID=A0A118JYD7_CYNCS|nr:CYTH-like domain-containing protein [Cynara cardunculus var. scolymus]